MSTMPSGVAMMMKALIPGFDPSKLGAQIEEVRTGAAQVVKHFDAKLTAIEAEQKAKLTAIEAEQKAQRVMLEELLRVARSWAPASDQAEAEAHTVDNGVARIAVGG